MEFTRCGYCNKPIPVDDIADHEAYHVVLEHPTHEGGGN